MRIVPFLLLALLLPLRAARAQALEASSIESPGVASPALTRTLPPPGSHSTAPRHAPRPERDRGTGAVYGAIAGALVGGIGFAAVNYTLTTSSPRDEYTLLSFLLGAAVGGAAGSMVGAIVGAPGRADSRSHTQVRLVPRVMQEAAVVSLSVPVSW